jgi:hypothetical protein
MSAQIPQILLERYRLNELPPTEAARLADLIRQDPQLRERLDALDRSDEEPARTAHRSARRRIEQRARADERPRADLHDSGRCRRRRGGRHDSRSRLRVRLPAPAATPQVSQTNTPAGDGIKGLRPTLAVYRRTADGSETLADGAVARRGDLVRVGYHAAGKSYGLIFSLDGRGAVTMHLPTAGEQAVPLARDATVLLDQAYELDDAPLWERFYFITGDTAFPVAPVVDAARRGAGTERSAPVTLILPHGLEQSTFSLQKEARP